MKLLLLLVAAAVSALAQSNATTTSVGTTTTFVSVAPVGYTGTASPTYSPLPGGAALRWPNATCPQDTVAINYGGYTQACCPDGTPMAYGDFCCPSDSTAQECTEQAIDVTSCADPNWWIFGDATTTFCCYEGWTGYVEGGLTYPQDNAGCLQPGESLGPSETAVSNQNPAANNPITTTATATTTAATSASSSASGITSTTGASSGNGATSGQVTQDSSSVPIGAIAGAVVAVVAIAGAVIIAVFWIRHRRSKRQHAGAIDPVREFDARDAPDAGKPMMQTDIEEKGDAGSAGDTWPADKKDYGNDDKRMSELGVPDSPRELIGGEIHELPADFHGFEMPPAAMDEPLEGSSRVIPAPATHPMSQTALENLLIDLDIPQSLRIGHRGSAYAPPAEAVPEESQGVAPQAEVTVAKSEELEKHDGPAETEADKNLSPPLEGAFPDRTGAVSPLMGARGENRDSEIRAVSPTPEDSHADATGAAADAEVHEERAPVSPQLEAQTEDEPQGQVATEVKRLERIATASDAELRR